MTHSFQRDFDDRKRQVRHYLAVVGNAEREVELGGSRVHEGRLLTLRAGTFLVLYNLVEATTRAAVEAIHDEITRTEAPFTALCLSLRKEVVRLFKKAANPATDHTLANFPAGFVAVALKQGINLSGTVDAKAIRALAECYGFSSQTDKETTYNGSDLLVVKRNRNDLAHGLKTFEEVGRDYTSTDLLLLSRRSMRYMDGILGNVAGYLDAKDYLESAVLPVGPGLPAVAAM